MPEIVTGQKKIILDQSLRKAARTNEGKFHVIPTKGKWGVRLEGSDRFAKILPTKAKAISIATSKAVANGSAVVIHTKDGRVSAIHSYGG